MGWLPGGTTRGCQTLAGMRRRGYTPEAIRGFIDKIGYTKYDGMNDVSLLEFAVREGPECAGGQGFRG